ncbi:MAG: hypothetical protein ACYDAR_09540 [Thermomicrobiales bacterium]
MYWDEPTSQSAKSWTTTVPHRKARGTVDRERQEYRLAVYRQAQERFRAIAADGAVNRTTAMWRALQDVCGTYDLEPAEWGLLIRCLMTASS